MYDLSSLTSSSFTHTQADSRSKAETPPPWTEYQSSWEWCEKCVLFELGKFRQLHCQKIKQTLRARKSASCCEICAWHNKSAIKKRLETLHTQISSSETTRRRKREFNSEMDHKSFSRYATATRSDTDLNADNTKD